MSKKSHGGEYDHPCNWFSACDPCNGGPLDKSDKDTQAKALALKRRFDYENYDLAKWNEIHSGRGKRLDEADIDRASALLDLMG